MTRSALALLAMLVLALPAAAADHLAPGEGPAGYQSPVMQDVFAAGVDVFAIVEPPFEAPYAVGMRLRNGQYRIFSLTGRKEYWARLLQSQSADASRYCETQIDSALGERVDRLWGAMVRGAGPGAERDAGVDSAHYAFAKIVDGRLTVGSEWDRDSDSAVGMLQSIAVAMDQLCHSPGDFERERFGSRVSALETALQGN
jgi:hypothetical protein